jgi:murein DD-endopeptidase MepM/ murein hydrolase activator NlpD
VIPAVSKVPAVAAIALSTMWTFAPQPTPGIRLGAEAIAAAAGKAIYFQYPLPTWEPHCLGFGSEWRYCNGTVLRQCSATGAVWLHTGVDIKTEIQPVMAAANGVIIGYTVDPQFRGGILIRHDTPNGVVITQYWHVWPRAGFTVGSVVTRGEEFADIADMGSRTHFHFAVFIGDYESTAWRGALPPSRCDGSPAFPYRFVNGTDFVQSHLQPEPRMRVHHCRMDTEP